jgi:nitrate/TMAO reductase-like tetraheme cytochrome c subunit
LVRFTVDLSQPKHRRNLFLLLVSLAIILVSVSIGAYQGYAYTESSEFCGTVCHTMDPQYTLYGMSEHANVECVECHVGPGFGYYIRSKIAGLRQVYALVTNTYSRPIKSPVHDLRPARETCQNCHTPTSFKDNVVKQIAHFDNDQVNTLIKSTLILKMGGWEQNTGISLGIHWHITNPVYYLAADDQRQVMLWVGVKQPDGTIKDYYSRDILLNAKTSLVAEAKAKGEIREMDCIDCHNRTAHAIPAPEKVVDQALELKLISTDIPYIRTQAIQLLKTQYASMEEASISINSLADFYQKNYPDFYQNETLKISSAISYLKDVYATTNFPEMNLNWQSNPDNENHSYTLGCFRCHDDKHVNVDPNGNEVNTISASCNLCHTVPIVGRGNELLIDAPVIVGSAPASHDSFSWTIAHQGISEAEKQDCYQCHGQGFCNNGVCFSNTQKSFGPRAIRFAIPVTKTFPAVVAMLQA